MLREKPESLSPPTGVAPRAGVPISAPPAPRIPYDGLYALRGRWLAADYTQLRNAAWAVRNCRVASELNPLALRLVLAEAERLIESGEKLADVLEAFAELLMKP